MTTPAPAASIAPATPAAGSPPAAGTATPAPAAPAAEVKQKFTVNGKEVELTVAQVRAAVQKGMFADQKLKSVDVLQGKTTALISALKTPEGLIGILQDKSLGANPKEVIRALLKSDFIDEELKEDIAKWTYERVVKTAKMTPEELEQNQKLSEYERLKKAENERKDAEASEKQKAQINQVYQAVRGEVTKQIVADKTFPQTEGAIRAVIDKLRVMNKKGTAITPDAVGKAIGLVKKDHVLHQQSMFDMIEDPEALIAFFGEARALKISKALVARIQAKSRVKPPAKTEPEGGAAEDKVTERIDKKLGKNRQGYHVMDV